MNAKFNFSYVKDSYGGLLKTEDVRLFYYDICFDKENANSFPYEWNEDVEEFIKKNNLEIKPLDRNCQPLTFENNKIYFEVLKVDEDNYAKSLFRHLRNSFSHYNIGDNGCFFCFKDFEGSKENAPQTMIGKIKKSVFYELIDIFFCQKAENEEKYNNYLCQKI